MDPSNLLTPNPSLTDLLPGLVLDTLVAQKVMGMDLFGPPPNSEHIQGARHSIPRYSTDIAAAWTVVKYVQEKNPGWRFSLLGGDVSMGYATAKDGSWKRDRNGDLVVVEQSREAFGWKAEFHGHLDPRKNTGQRYGSEYATTAPHAICLTALKAMNA